MQREHIRNNVLERSGTKRLGGCWVRCHEDSTARPFAGRSRVADAG